MGGWLLSLSSELLLQNFKLQQPLHCCLIFSLNMPVVLCHSAIGDEGDGATVTEDRTSADSVGRSVREGCRGRDRHKSVKSLLHGQCICRRMRCCESLQLLQEKQLIVPFSTRPHISRRQRLHGNNGEAGSGRARCCCRRIFRLGHLDCQLFLLLFVHIICRSNHDEEQQAADDTSNDCRNLVAFGGISGGWYHTATRSICDCPPAFPTSINDLSAQRGAAAVDDSLSCCKSNDGGSDVAVARENCGVVGGVE